MAGLSGQTQQLQRGMAGAAGQTRKFTDNMVTFNRYAREMQDVQDKNAAAAKRLREMQLAGATAINAVTRATNPAIASTRMVSGAVRDAEKAYMAGSISAGALARAQKIGAPWLEKTALSAEHAGRSMLVMARNVRFLIAAFGIQLVGRFASWVGDTIKSTAALGDQAKQLGITTDALQEFHGIAGQAGLSAEDMDSAFSHLKQTISDIALGKADTASKLFKKLGVDIYDAAGKIRPTEDVFLELIDKLKRVGNEAQRTGALQIAYGEAGSKMGQLVAQGSDGIEKLREAVRQTGMVLSAETIQKADVTAKKLDMVSQVLGAKIASTIVENAGAISTLADALLSLVSIGLERLVSNIAALVQRFKEMHDTLQMIKNDAADTDQWSIPKALGADMSHAKGGWITNWWQRRNAPPSITVPLPPLSPMKAKPKPAGGNISLDGLLAPKGKHGGKAPLNEFEREQLHEEEEHLRLLKDRTGNLTEQNDIEKQLIDIKLQERFHQLDDMVKRKSLTKAQADKLKLEAQENADLEKEAADRKMREAQIERQNQYADELAQLEQDALDIARSMARTDDERRKIDLAILDSKQQQAVSELDKQIALAEEAQDETRIAQLTDERAKLLANQRDQLKQFDVEHLTGMDKFRHDLPNTDAELADAIKNLKFDLFNQKLQQAAQFAGDIGDAFGTAAGALARFESPLSVLQGLISDLAQTFTKNFIEKPVSDWVTQHIGIPAAKQGFGKDLTGPDALTAQQFNIALAQATGTLGGLTGSLSATAPPATASLTELTAAATAASSALTSMAAAAAAGGGGGGGGAGGIIGALLGSLGGSSGVTGAGGFDFSSLGLAAGLPDVYPGFSGGGYTGPGNDNEVAGLVHRNEWVLDAAATRRLRPLLPMLDAGRLPNFGSGSGLSFNPLRGHTPLQVHFGDMIFPGVTDARTARASATQVTSRVHRGIAKVVRKGMGNSA